jgi:hypothetical protein
MIICVGYLNLIIDLGKIREKKAIVTININDNF